MASRKSGTSVSPASAAVETDGAEALPRAVRLTRPHGFIDENGIIRHWRAGYVADDAEEVALLVGRGAQHEVVE